MPEFSHDVAAGLLVAAMVSCALGILELCKAHRASNDESNIAIRRAPLIADGFAKDRRGLAQCDNSVQPGGIVTPDTALIKALSLRCQIAVSPVAGS